jgi:ADP-ribose pyrophosphatase YjhB (NUDIX family)
MENLPLHREDIPAAEEPQLTRIAYMVLRKNEDIMLLRRKRTGNYSFPAGHIEAGETPKTGAIREALEEVGVKINPENSDLIHQFRHQEDQEGKSFVDFYFFEARIWEGDPQVMEKEVHDRVVWANINGLPPNMSSNIREIITAHFSTTKKAD